MRTSPERPRLGHLQARTHLVDAEASRGFWENHAEPNSTSHPQYRHAKPRSEQPVPESASDNPNQQVSADERKRIEVHYVVGVGERDPEELCGNSRERRSSRIVFLVSKSPEDHIRAQPGEPVEEMVRPHKPVPEELPEPVDCHRNSRRPGLPH